MKKVLIIIHLPRASPRIEGLVKYLPEFNWQPIILTGVTGNSTNLPARIIETPYRNALGVLGKLFRIDPAADTSQQMENRFGTTSKKSPLDFFFKLGGEFINYPCPDKNWGPFALKAGKELLKNESIDAVISTSPPVISHIIARQLKDAYNIPWLADLRDLWSLNHNYRYSPLRKLLDRRLELHTLGKADALVTVSDPLAEELRTLHKEKTVYPVSHGFDPSDVNIPPAKLTKKFTITYTGNIYQGRQDPLKLFTALRDLISDGTINPSDIEVRFYGAVPGWLVREAEQHGLSHIIKHHGSIPHDAAIEKQRESQLLLLLDWDDPKERGVYTGKIFEYLGARRPILATGGIVGNVIDVLLDDTGAGIHACTTEDTGNALRKLYREYKLKGEITYCGEESKLDQYSQREMAGKFAEAFNRLM
ncbi:glycosyltransferase [Chloroflexota bacterium]